MNQSIEPTEPKIDRSNKNIPLEQLRELRSRGLTMPQIAKLCDCSVNNVWLRLKGFEDLEEEVEVFRTHEVNIIAGIREKLLNSIDPETIKKAPLQTKIFAYGVLFDKERLLLGLSTNNVSVGFSFARSEPAPPDTIGTSDTPDK